MIEDEVHPISRAVEIGFRRQAELSMTSPPERAFRHGAAEVIRHIPPGRLLQMMQETGLRDYREALAQLIEQG